jgi:hypothetical protein
MMFIVWYSDTGKWILCCFLVYLITLSQLHRSYNIKWKDVFFCRRERRKNLLGLLLIAILESACEFGNPRKCLKSRCPGRESNPETAEHEAEVCMVPSKIAESPVTSCSFYLYIKCYNDASLMAWEYVYRVRVCTSNTVSLVHKGNALHSA